PEHSHPQPPSHPEQPSPSPSPDHTHQAPDAASDEPGIVTPTGAYVGLGLAALITAAWATLQLRRRIRYRPGTPRHHEPAIAPIVRTLRATVHDRAHPSAPPTDTEEDPEHLALEPAPTTPPPSVPEVAAVREHAHRLAHATAAEDGPATGTRDGHALAVDLARTRGLGLTGPGAHHAARALLITIVANHHRPGADPTRLLIPATDAAQLLGPDAARPPHPPRLHLVDDLDAALEVMEHQLLTRTRTRADSEVASTEDELVLLATPQPQSARRLQAILDNGSTLGMTGILLGPWQPGSTLRVRDDGRITATSPDTPQALAAGARLFTVPQTDARDLLNLLRQPDLATPPPKPAPHRAVSIAETGNPAPAPPTSPSTPNPADDEKNEAEDDDPTATPDRPESTPPKHTDGEPHPQAPPAPRAAAPSRLADLAVLGRVRLTHHQGADSTAEIRLAPRQREVLAFLALHPRGAHRDVICAALWPDSRQPRNTFHATVSQLRRTLTTHDDALADLLQHHDGTYHLDVDHVHVDLWELHDQLATAATSDTEQQKTALRRIGALYDDLATDLHGEWLHAPRETLRRDVLDAHSTLIRELLRSHPDTAAHFLEQARRIDPYNESLYRDIAQLQSRTGQHDSIPRTLALLRTSLAEIDETPSVETLRFFEITRDRHTRNAPR
ncbi:AfsR/SARP family transcriptional regulator, partial [Streptomyces sp. 4N509B]|uniref:AfsR/SARP family transcriptional regulator n=1 Tax=Streptomyces sp. 4N509B TaxID=3457413 RepID=UPI003FCF6826